MNTLFVIFMWLLVYYLIFCPLTEDERTWKIIDPIYRMFAEGYDGTD